MGQIKLIKQMRLILILLFLGVVAFNGDSLAQVSIGICKDCHTMHYAQRLLETEGAVSRPPAIPTAGLTTKDCVGCHAQGGSYSITKEGIPQVYHTDANDLAAGSFKYVEDSDAKGHNVYGISGISADRVLDGRIPPGYSSSYDPAIPTKYTANRYSQVTCAGTFGCHGNRDYVDQADAVFGAHHEIDDCLKFGTINEVYQGANVGTSYRFLYRVKGGEDDDWQYTKSPTDHNEYKGAEFGNRTGQTWSTVDTISELCAECHGDFHSSSGIGSGSPWSRHPTDKTLPGSGEYVLYIAYSEEGKVTAPVARTTIPNAPSSTVTPGADSVMCLSCHRAHGSSYPDILRWDYTNMGKGEGCLTCHTEKSVK